MGWRAALLVVCWSPALWAHERTRGVIGFVDAAGALAFKHPEVHEAGDFADGLVVVRLHRDGVLKFGYLDRQGAFAIQPRLDWAAPFAEGLAFARRRDERKSGFIDKQGRWVIELGIDDGRAFAGGVAPVKVDGRWGFIDRQGAFIVKPSFDDAESFRDGRARVKVGERWGFVDKSGTLVISTKFSYAAHFSDGLARVRIENGPIAFIDRDGKTAVGPLAGVAEAGDFRDGRSLVRVKTKWGYIDTTGRQVIPAAYEAGTPFSGDLAAVQQGGKWLVIDRDGHEKARLDCDWTLGFAEGRAPILVADKMGFADTAGKLVLPAKQVRVYAFAEGLARVELE